METKYKYCKEHGIYTETECPICGECNDEIKDKTVRNLVKYMNWETDTVDRRHTIKPQ